MHINLVEYMYNGQKKRTKISKLTIGFLQTSQTYFKNRADCKISLKKDM